MQNDSNADKIDLIRLVKTALRHVRYSWILCVFLVVVFALAGNFLSRRFYSPTYQVRASFVVNAYTEEDAGTYSHNYTNSQIAKQLNETFPYVLTSGALSRIVAADLGYDSLPVSVSAEALGEINIFRITVSGSDPQLCMDALDSIIANYPEVAKYILGTTELELLSKSSLPTKSVNAPNYNGDMKKGAMLGVLVYLMLIVFRAFTSRTVYDKRMLSRYISVPVLASVPRIGSQKKARKSPIMIAQGAVSGQYRESMETLRHRVTSKLEHRHWNSLYVTSSMAGEGKSTMACNLAVLMAQHGNSVVLVDADLRNPSVSRTLGLDREKQAQGMNEFLNGDIALDKILVKTEVENLLVLPGGKAVDRVDDQFSNGRFRNLIESLKKKADYVIVDTPPCAMLDDAVIAAECLDGGLLVVRKDYASIDAVIAGNELLSKTASPLFGCVMNFTADV